MYLLERINKTTLGKAVLDCIQCKLLPLENRDHFVLKIPFLRLKGSKDNKRSLPMTFLDKVGRSWTQWINL